MGEIWLPGAGRHYPGNSAGSMNQDGSRKLGLHSTEGSSIAGAVGAYRDHDSWPHITADARRRVFEQHLSLDVAARSFKNLPGGDETNREGTFLVQVELVGSAQHPESIGSPEDLDWLGRVVIGPACRATGVPMVCTVPFLAYPASYGGSPVRLSVAAWDAYNGVLGHQHVPENVHGDPGALDVDRVLTAARNQEDEMSAAEVAAINKRIDELSTRMRETDRDVEALKAQVGDGFADVKAQLNAFLAPYGAEVTNRYGVPTSVEDGGKPTSPVWRMLTDLVTGRRPRPPAAPDEPPDEPTPPAA